MSLPTACRAIGVAAGLLLAGCGGDYQAPRRSTTGEPAAPLGQSVDLDVSLPGLHVVDTGTRGASLEMRLEIEGAGDGRHDARVHFDKARAGARITTIEDLSGGRTTVLVDGADWTTGRIGPLRIGGSVFEMMLDGASPDGGWTLSGTSWESQSGLGGTFGGWRRHRFLVAATDFVSAGRVSEVAWVRNREIRVRSNLAPVSTDPVLSRTERSVFVVNRLGFDNLQRLDPRSDFATVWEAGMGLGANPHDAIWLTDDKVYVTRYEPPFDDVAIVSPRGGTILGTIPLESYAENRDATPRADRMVHLDDQVFVGLQDIDRTFTRFGEGKLAVIDSIRDEVTGVIPLGGKNPGQIELLTRADGSTRLYVALAGVFPGQAAQELSGGVVVVDPVSRAVEHMALDDDDAGGNVAGLALVSESLGYVVVSTGEFRNRVLAFDPERAVVLREVFSTPDLVGEIAVDRQGVLAIPDASFTDPRLCLYRAPADPAAPETLLGCGALDLAPFSVEVLD